MKTLRPPWPTGIGWALALGLAILAGPATARAQSTPEAGKPPAEKKDDAAAKRADEIAKKLAAQAEKEKMGPQPPRSVNQTPTKPRGNANQVPEPTVVLKPGEMPGIKFDMTTYDFGRIRAGGDVVHDFWFTNTGNGPLELLRVKPG
ncbi:MAG: DUF1573 domain-containing protein [Phycisphaerales bacterium]|nr:DUF1573 domain-containing protein [Phycisphaerales bacterium]MCB9862374.1 DUF1573 domain-containing protein [Phycisphaerales bacterium]